MLEEKVEVLAAWFNDMLIFGKNSSFGFECPIWDPQVQIELSDGFGHGIEMIQVQPSPILARESKVDVRIEHICNDLNSRHKCSIWKISQRSVLVINYEESSPCLVFLKFFFKCILYGLGYCRVYNTSCELKCFLSQFLPQRRTWILPSKLYTYIFCHYMYLSF